ncbi:DUF4115 domain-containing protein [Lamprobacter modestohalophilus]|uniref:RodZ domain-containing protein n=1 Tax=Lamprobacter modestohalophilus TaxID=1064514 RepID=UPI002ADEAFBC|nr:RodZ domain-containing protein [Lamprobacter modestohalophilus]MEA1051057.1 DUF4115 domain-containing protein [Lamprobacter modestohalophilus]
MAEEADAITPNEPATRSGASTSATDSPGQQLRQAREARKLDISQLATSLRIAPQVVEALEQDDYKQLPSAVFVSGYIRSYARLVGLDPEPLNQSFRRLHPNVEPPTPHVVRTESSQSDEDNPEGGGLAVYLIAVLVVLALAAGGYGWWVSRPGPSQQTNGQPDLNEERLSALPATGAVLDDEPRQPSTSLESEPQTIRTPESGSDSASTPLSTQPADSRTLPQTASADVLVLGQGDQQRASTPDQSDAASPGATSEPTASATDERTLELSSTASVGDAPARQPASGPLPTPASPEDERPAVRPTAALIADNAAANAPSEAEAATDNAAAASTSQAVELAFTGPCWVDIRDSTGKVLLFGEMNRGSRETLAGEPPYSLVIGNAAAAKLTVAGQPFDLTSVARGNVARFKLDPAEVSRQTSDASAGTSADTDTEQSN